MMWATRAPTYTHQFFLLYISGHKHQMTAAPLYKPHLSPPLHPSDSNSSYKSLKTHKRSSPRIGEANCAFFIFPFSLFGTQQKNQSVAMSLAHSKIYHTQSVFAGFLQTCEDLNKDKIRSKQINHSRELLPCSACGCGRKDRFS